jgi:hypothetical protein
MIYYHVDEKNINQFQFITFKNQLLPIYHEICNRYNNATILHQIKSEIVRY